MNELVSASLQSRRVSGTILTFPRYAFMPCKATTLPCLSYPVPFLSCGITERKELTCLLCAAMFTFPDLFLNVATGSLNCVKKTEWLKLVSEHAMKGIKWCTGDIELLANCLASLHIRLRNEANGSPTFGCVDT